MAGNTISIGFDYRKQLEKAVKDIETSFDKALGSSSYGIEFERQVAAFKDMLMELKDSLNDSFKGISAGKLDTDKFDAFRTKVTRDFQKVDGEIDSLNKSIKTLNGLLGISGEGVDLSSAINQFKELQNYINANNDAVTKLLKTLKKSNTDLVFDAPSFSIDDAKSKIEKLNELISDEGKSFGGQKSKELQNNYKALSKELQDLLEQSYALEDQLAETNRSDPMFLKMQAELSEAELKLKNVSAALSEIHQIANEKGYSWTKNVDTYEWSQILDIDNLKNIETKVKSTLSELNNYIKDIASSSVVISEKIEDGVGAANIQVRIGTRDNTLRKELEEKISKLQSHLNANPLILPVKMVVSNARTTSENPLKTSTDAIKKAQKALQDETSNVQMNTDDLPKQTLKQALINAERAAKESQKRIQEVFDAVPVQVHLEILPEEIEKVSRAIFDENGETKVDISDQIGKTIKHVDTLILKLKDVDKQVGDTKNNRFLEFSEEIKKSISDLSSLKDILTSIKDLESTIARATNVSTSDEITAQWNKTKFLFDYISDNKDNLNLNTQKKQITELMTEYQKYLDMGSKNPLRYLTDNEKTVEKLYSQYRKFSSLIRKTNEVTTKNNIETQKIEEKSLEKETTTTIKVKPSINPQEFANEVTEQLTGYNVQIGVEPKVKDGSLFDKNSKKEIQIKPIITDESTEEIQNENNAFDETDKSAKKAAKSKEEFKKSNKLLAEGASESSKEINNEINALSSINDQIQTINLDKNSEEFKNAAKSARQYFNELGEIASITRTSGTYNTYNSHTGKTEQEQRISYRITDVNGNSRTVNPQGELIGSKDIVRVVDEYKKYLRIQEEIYKINLKEASNGKLTAEQLSKRDKLLKDIQDQTDKLFDLEQKGLENAELRDEIYRRQQAYRQTEIDTQTKRLISNPLTDFENKLTKLETNKNLSKQTDEYKEKLEEIHNLLGELKSYEQSGIELFNQDTISNVNNITQQIENLFSTVSDMDKVANQAKATGIISNIEDYISKNSSLRMSKQGRGYIEELRTLQTELKNTALTAPELQDIVIKFNNIKTSITEAGLAGRSFFDVIKSKAFYMAAETFARLFSIQDIIRYVRTAITTIRQLDTALVDLRKTTTMSSFELDRFYKSSNAIAKQMGVTTKEIINQASAWSRLGYSSADAAETMAELSSQFAAISPGMDVNQATDGLVSSMKAFGIEVSDAERKISDNINRIGNTAATSNQEIVEMLTRSSAAMATANNTIEETIALETAAVEITRNAETTGTAFKTLAMRIRGYDEETEELSDNLKNIAGDIADLTKINGKGGISLFTDETKETYKSTYQILKEISEIWDQLSDKNQAQLLEKLAGKRGGQVVAGLLTNFSAAEKAMNEMANAAGSADAEMKIIQESIDFKINALKETWVSVFQNLIDRDDIGKIVDGLTAISEAISFITKNIGILGTAGVGLGTFLGIKDLGRGKMLSLKLLII